MVTNIHEHKRYYYTFDNSLFTESICEHYTNLSTLNHNVRFLPQVIPGRWHNAIRGCYKPCVHRFNYSPDTPAEKFPVRSDIVNPGIQRRFIAPDIH